MKRKKIIEKVVVIFFAMFFYIGIKNNVMATVENPCIEINPVYEEILSEKEKENILEELRQKNEEGLYKSKTYDGSITINEKNYTVFDKNTYSGLITAIQECMINRCEDFIVFYEDSEFPNAETTKKMLFDAMSENYSILPEGGDYLLYSLKGYYIPAVSEVKEGVYAIRYGVLYYTTYAQEQQLTNVIDNYITQYKPSIKTQIEIISDFNEYVCENVTYDYDNLKNDGYTLKYSAYAALINHRAVCQGYSILYYRLLKECGINVRVVVSQEINHAWNLVKCGDYWYYIDTTWNDAYDERSYPYQDFFMKSAKDFLNHGDLTETIPSVNDYNVSEESFNVSTERIDIINAVYTINDRNYGNMLAKGNVDFTLTYNSIELINGKDYVAYYDFNNSLLEITVTIYGINNYKGITTFKVNGVSSVSNLKTVSTKSREIMISWDYSKKATEYKIYRYNFVTKRYDYLTATNNNYFVNTGLESGTVYVYQVIAYENINNIESQAVYLTEFTNPDKVQVVKATSQTTSSINLTWNKVAGATGYRIYRYNSATKKYNHIKTITANAYTDTNLKTGTSYLYKVIAYKTYQNVTKWGEYSTILNSSTKTKKPSISKISTSNKKVTLKWGKISGATGYEIYMKKGSSGKYSRIKTITKNSTTSYIKTNLKKGTKYYFKIRTYRTVNGQKIYSDYSSVKSIKVK